MLERDIPGDYLPDWVAPNADERVQTPEFDLELRMERDMSELGETEADIAENAATRFAEAGAGVRIALHEPLDPGPMRQLAGMSLAGLGAVIARKHTLAGAAAGASGAALRALDFRGGRARQDAYTVLAQTGSREGDRMVALVAGLDTPSVACLQELARQLEVFPTQQVRVLLVCTSSPVWAHAVDDADPLPDELFVLRLDDVGGGRLTLPSSSGRRTNRRYPSDALHLLRAVAADLGIGLTDGPALAGADALSAETSCSARLATVDCSDAATPYGALTDAVRLSTALVHRLDVHWPR